MTFTPTSTGETQVLPVKKELGFVEQCLGMIESLLKKANGETPASSDLDQQARKSKP